MKLWVPIEELRNQVNLTQLTASQKDDELITYALAAQELAEDWCKRYFDGSILRSEYHDGDESSTDIVTKAYPILSITDIRDDISLVFGSDTIVSSSDYLSIADLGQIRKISGIFTSGKKNLKITYKGGFISEQTLVAAATPANTMTVSAQTVFASKPFKAIVTTGVASTAGNVTITGTDENGSAQIEIIVIPASSAAIPSYRKYSKLSWSTITQFDALPINTSGATVKLTAINMPDKLRTAIGLYTAHFYLQDNSRSINVGSRNVESDSESNYQKDVPKEFYSLLAGFRNYQ